MKFKKNGGFTLVELIVVIAILAILAGVAVPAYSGYIKKAEKAGDLQLLGAVNTAFAAACLENGYGVETVVGANIQVSAGKVGNVTSVSVANPASRAASGTALDGTTVAAISASFTRFYASNADAEFKVIDLLQFDPTTHTFAGLDLDAGEGAGAYNEVLNKLLGSENAEKLDKLMGSVWGENDASYLTGKVDWTSDIANEMLMGNSGGSFSDMITNCGSAMMDFMGITDPAAQATKIQELAVSKMNQLIANNPKYAGLDAAAIFASGGGASGSVENELFMEAQNSIAVNNAILTAAKNSEGAAANIQSILGSENSKSQLIHSVNAGMTNNDTSGAMGEVALAYAMYMSYAERNNIEVNDVQDVLNGLEDGGFKNYVNNTDGSGNFQKDMDGYLASMEMINSSVQGNADAVTDVVLNGFDNTDLVNVLNHAMNSTK